MKALEFIKLNEQFWAMPIGVGESGQVLVEYSRYPPANHVLGVVTYLLRRAKGLSPIWVNASRSELDICKSYCRSAQAIPLPFPGIAALGRALSAATTQFGSLKNTADILPISYRGVRYGDLIYDQYLAKRQFATIHKCDLLLYKIMLFTFMQHERVDKLLNLARVSSVLVAHRVGLQSGILLRSALSRGLDAYSFAGQDRGTLVLSRGLEQANDYEYTPTRQEIERLLELPSEIFDSLYNETCRRHLAGQTSNDSEYAFSKDNVSYTNRDAFCSAYQLDPRRRNIFVMLHAMTDYPHSHFRGMVFRDYFDWFHQTFKFSLKHDECNWIFKQHPSARFYPTRDVDLTEYFKETHAHIRYISDSERLSTSSLCQIADAVITCIGSAGFELPAMGGVPAVTAGDNHYGHFGFAEHPRTPEQYFDVLSKLSEVKPLSGELRRLAQAVFIFIYRSATVDLSCVPRLSFNDVSCALDSEWYWTQISNRYDQLRSTIENEIEAYVGALRDENFRALRRASQ